jgi:hypothetical protein
MIAIDPFTPEESVLKENDVVCHCFHYTRKQIETDYLGSGRSKILEKITNEKKTGGCDCARKNPKGR